MCFQEVPSGQKEDDVVGRPMMHLSALKQTTGEAVYCDDIPLYENELYLALVTSTKAHARILYVTHSLTSTITDTRSLTHRDAWLTRVCCVCPQGGRCERGGGDAWRGFLRVR